MKAEAALGFVVIGAGFLVLAGEADERRLRRAYVAAGFGGAVSVFALLTLFETVTGVPLGFDEVFVTDLSAFGGRIGPATAIGFACAGAALVLLAAAGGGGTESVKAAHSLSLAPSAVGYLALIAYADDLRAFQPFLPSSSEPMTGLSLLCLTVAILSVTPDEGWRKPIAAFPIARWLFERLFAVAILAPLAATVAIAYGAKLHLYPSAYVAALLAFSWAIATVGSSLMAVDYTRHAEARLVETERANRRGFGVLRRIDEPHQDVDDARGAVLARRAATLENAAVGLAEVGFDGRFLWVNDRLCAITGYDRERLQALAFRDVAHPEDLAAILSEARRLKAGEIQSCALIERWFHKDGAPIWVNLTLAAVRRRDGSPDCLVAVVEDITAHKRAEERLLASETALKEADRRKDEFLATLGHELRNPLAPMRSGLHVLRKEAAFQNERAKQICDMMDRQVDYLIRLVDDLLEVSRITRGKTELRKERLDLANVISQAVEMSMSLIAKGKHELSVVLPSQPLTLDADPVRLTQVLANLLNNAAKYTEAGGRIVLSARCEGREAVVSVRDNGVGVRPELLPRIFDLFSQLDSTASRAQGGLGIGLALVRNLVERHGGRVEAASAGVGRGSEFTLWLPLPDETVEEPSLSEPTKVAATRKRRVLIVDDTRAVADSFALLVRALGAEVRVAYDGPSAVDAMAEFHPEIAFLDLGMPEMDGFETAKLMRQQPGGKDLKLVALSGWGQNEHNRLGEEAGFDHRFVKPMDMKALQALLHAP